MGSHEQGAAPLRVGAAMTEITPPVGTHLAGDIGRLRAAQAVLDPLHAKAVVVESSGRRLCVLALDVTIITQEYTDFIRAEASRRFGLDSQAIMVHATQTHSAPPLGHFMLDEDFPSVPADMEWLRGGQAEYSRFAAGRAVEAIGQAVAALRPAHIGVGSGVRDGLAFNRRGIQRNGKACMPWLFSGRQMPLGPTDIRYMEGPTDPEVGVFVACDSEMRISALLLHHTCHPVNVYAQPGRAVSADWPGAWGAAMQQTFGAACVPLVLNGCCGNINPWPAFEPDFMPDHRRMGAALAEMAGKVVQNIRLADRAAVDWRVVHLPIPLKPVPAELVREAQKRLEADPKPPWLADEQRVDFNWFMAASLMSIEYARRRNPNVDYEIQVFRIGDLAIVALPGEPFVEGQLAIKIKSPAAQTFVGHCCTQYVGYLPTREAFAHGGHEVNPTYWAKLAPEALDMAVEAAGAMLKELFAAK